MRKTSAAAFCAVLVVGVGAAAVGSATAASKTDVVLKATLTGKYLHTTSTGSGIATITVKPTKVCWKFAYKGLDRGGDSGIHIVPPPAAGMHKTSVFPFTASTSTAPGCVSRTAWGANDAKFVDRIVADPSHFYVIVATKKYPQGAIGGVLRAG
jgi:CHRD domain